MNTDLNINFKTKDCKLIYEDFIKLRIDKIDGLNPETYLLFNKLKGMNCSYSNMEQVQE